MLQAMSFNPPSSLHSVSLRYTCITVQQVREFVLVSFLSTKQIHTPNTALPGKSQSSIYLLPAGKSP